MRQRNFARRRAHQAGFTLIEALVAIAVTVMVIVGVLEMFDLQNKVAVAQRHVTEMQQSIRVGQYDMVRLARMAGRGGLPTRQAAQALPDGIGMAVRPDTPANTHLIAGDTDSPKILEGTDQLVLRGVFSSPIYQIAYAIPASYQLTDPANPGAPDPRTATGGAIEVCSRSHSGVPQDLTPLTTIIQEAAADATKARPEALVLVSPLADTVYAVVELDPVASTEAVAGCASGSGVTLRFKSDPAQQRVASYRALSAAPAGENMHSGLTKVGWVGVLEEYRFYIREEWMAGENTSQLAPVLTRARFFPGTDEPYSGNAAELQVDLADNIIDFQVAMGIDADADGTVVENVADAANDEWMGNDPADAALVGRLAYLRLSTLARTHRPDRTYEAPDLAFVENHVYDPNDADDRINGTNTVDGQVPRKFRRRLLQTIIDLRNLS
jgi:type II secretory pathway pseudopilin PulG